MKHLRFVILIGGIVLFTILISGCGQVGAENPTILPTEIIEPTSSQDTSIVWSDDFVDGDLGGWEVITTDGGDFFIEDGALKSEFVDTWHMIRSFLQHPSNVTVGTWSYDIFFAEYPLERKTPGPASYLVGFMANSSMEDIDHTAQRIWETNTKFRSYILKYVEAKSIEFSLVTDGKSIFIGQHSIQDLSGWQHFDITRDTNGRTQVYLNGEQIFAHTDENFTESQFFFLGALRHSEEVFDNIVVRDTVVEILPMGE